MRRHRDEYHTGRLNISCPPSVKDAIAADATAHDQSISQFILSLYETSVKAGTSSHLARMSLDLMGLKKRLLDIDTHLCRSLRRSRGVVDPAVQEDLKTLKALSKQLDATLQETIGAMKVVKQQEDSRLM